MPDFRVTWEIDVFDAPTPEAAARKALKTQRNPESIATVFRVSEHDSPEGVEIDLTELDEVTIITEHVVSIPVDPFPTKVDLGAVVCTTPSVTGLGDDILNAQRRWAGQVIEMGWEAGHDGIGFWARSAGHEEGPNEGDGIFEIELIEWEDALDAIGEGGGLVRCAPLDEAWEKKDPRIAKFIHKLTADALVTTIEKVVKVLAPEAKDPDSWVCGIARLWSEDPEQLDDSIANMDAGLADCLIQYAVLGEVRYG